VIHPDKCLRFLRDDGSRIQHYHRLAFAMLSRNKMMNHRIREILSIFAILAFSMQFNAVLLAQSPREWMKCLGLEGPIMDTVIDGCTAVIQSGQEPREKLATAFDNRGVAYKLKGQYDRALQDYEQAIRLNPSNANAYNNRGVIYRIKGEYGRAIADYDEAIWLKNGDLPPAYYNRALPMLIKVSMNSRSGTSTS
jgi:tetratricopeptide (TPR) repeat protein